MNHTYTDEERAARRREYKYSIQELHDIILPMIRSLGTRRPEELANAIIELIKQDREANAKTS